MATGKMMGISIAILRDRLSRAFASGLTILALPGVGLKFVYYAAQSLPESDEMIVLRVFIEHPARYGNHRLTGAIELLDPHCSSDLWVDDRR